MLLLDTNNGALRRLLLLPDAQESPKRTSWWSSKEEMVRNSTCLYYTKGFFKSKLNIGKTAPGSFIFLFSRPKHLIVYSYVCLNALHIKQHCYGIVVRKIQIKCIV